MTNQFISSDDIKSLVIGAAGDFTGGLLSSLLLASKIAHRFQPDKQKQALKEALEEALTEACKLFPEAQKSVTRYYLDQLSKFLKAQIVIAEIGKLLDPNPATLLEKELLSQEFTRITQGYRPDQIPDLDFDLFVETLVYTFYMAVKGKEPLQEIIKIERLDQLVQQVVKTFILLEALLASSEGSSRGIAELILIAQRQAQTIEEIKLLLEAQRDGLILFPQFKTPIENFLISYLGTDKEPVPFGGRDEQLAQLEQWRSQSTRQRLLLVAPAGRGKSALLVRWSQKLVNRDDVAVLFMPISARFGTNRDEVTFACLAVRLAHLYGKEIPTDFAHFTPNLWRGLFADYLREPLPDGRQLLVILDGLDEAAWDGYEDIFPLQLPPEIRLVVSARYRAGEAVSPRPWLQRLGWDRFTELAETLALPELSLDGVRDVLIKMGCPLDELGAQVDIVSELYRLSEGAPLLVELYVKDLWSKGMSVTRLKPQDLEKIQPGYKGFFDKWWDDQEKLWGREKPLLQSMTRTLLNLLATAWGPLLLDDLLAILARDPLVDGFHIQEAIKPLSRFVLGDGREQGYVFAHPRLGDYFWDGLGHRDQIRWEDLFIDWGQTTIKQLEANLLRYEDMSLYLLQYYTSHLRRRESPLDSYLSLLSYQWMQAWHKKIGTYTGFLRDVDRVWAKLRRANEQALAKGNSAPNIGLEVRCALYHASIRSLAENLSDELLVLLLTNKIWTEEQVLAYSRHRLNVVRRCRTLTKVALELSPQQRMSVLTEVVEMAHAIDKVEIRSRALTELARHLPKNEQAEIFTLVMNQVSAIEDEESRTQILSDIAPYMPHDVLHAARSIESNWHRGRLLTDLAPHLPQKKRKEMLLNSLASTMNIEPEWARVQVLTAMAPHLPEEILAAATVAKNAESRAHILTAVAPHLHHEQYLAILAQAMVAANAVEEERSRIEVLIALAHYLPMEVFAATSTIKDEGYRTRVLTELAPAFPREILAAESSINDEGLKARILAAVAPHLPYRQQTEILNKAIKIACSIKVERYRVLTLMELATRLPYEVLRVASSIIDKRSRANIFTTLAQNLPNEARESVLIEALAAASVIEDERSRVGVFISFTPHLPLGKQADVLTKAMTLANTVENEWARVRLFVALAPYLPTEVMSAISTIEHEWPRFEVLMALIPHFPHEVKLAANAIVDEKSRANIYISLAAYLPQEERNEVLYKALIAANAIEDRGTSAYILGRLAFFLPDDERADILNKAFLAANSVENEMARVKVLSILAYHMPEVVWTTALEIKGELPRAQLIAGLTPFYPREILATAKVFKDENARTLLLTALAPYLTQEVLDLANCIEGTLARTNVYVALIPYLPQEVQAQTITKVLAETANVKNMEFRANALRMLAPYLPSKDQVNVLIDALVAASEIEVESTRSDTLLNLLPALLETPVDAWFSSWQSFLQQSAIKSRPDLLSDISNNVSVIKLFGGQEALTEVLEAIQDVTEWWP